MAILHERPSCLLALSPVALTLIALELLLLLLLKELSPLVFLQSVRRRSTASFCEARAGPPHEADREFGLAHDRVAFAVCVGHCHRHDCIRQHGGNDGEEDHGKFSARNKESAQPVAPFTKGLLNHPHHSFIGPLLTEAATRRGLSLVCKDPTGHYK